MRAWTVAELDNVVASLTPLQGLRLQEVSTSVEDVVLGFYSPDGMLWLWIDLQAVCPSILPWMELPLRPTVQKTPLLLFLRAHFIGRTLQTIERLTSRGRVLLLRFGGPADHLEIELRLFPHARNILLRAGERSIAWQKPKDLTESVEDDLSARAIRSLEDLRAEWRRRRVDSKISRKSLTKTTDPLLKLKKEIEKKQTALKKVEQELQRKLDLPWREVGDHLKLQQSLDTPKDWEPFVDRRRKLAWNIENCFVKAREVEGKLAGTRHRYATLKAELTELEARLSDPKSVQQASGQKVQSAPLKIIADRRTLRLTEGAMAVMGKSAADNLKILRKARAWDLWLHLRDQPSSHAVIFRNKGAATPESQVLEVAMWFVRNQLGQKAARHVGEKFSLVITECRHVHPIKGDKLGRVTFRDERVLMLQFLG